MLNHDIKITYEAMFDYAYLFGLFVDDESTLPLGFNARFQTMQREVKEFLQKNKKFWNKRYFKIKYLTKYDEFVYLFVRLMEMDDTKRVWNVVGICFCDDWSDEWEDIGQIKVWLDSCVENVKNEPDWVVEHYKYKIIDYLEAIWDESGREGYIRACDVLIKKLSGKRVKGKTRKYTTKRIRSYITEKLTSASIGDEVVRTLDELLELERQRNLEMDFYR